METECGRSCQNIGMHILVDMEKMTFYSLEELNTVLWQKMEQENRENFQGLTYSRTRSV